MSEFDDDFDDDEQMRRAAIVRRAKTEGIEVAYETALRVCKDPKSPAQAQSNAARTLLQIGGLLERADRVQQFEGKNLAELTGEELQAEIAKATARRARPRQQPARVGAAQPAAEPEKPPIELFPEKPVGVFE
ncbi:hypothetical protein [Kaistia sp. UC242_56]|uniref:hypothetical protein n=1 Tax=Kaistia sp. UC242_56 TaxID=3374625 RepID=UPI0037BD7773